MIVDRDAGARPAFFEIQRIPLVFFAALLDQRQPDSFHQFPEPLDR
jgi:hypothetical protein